MKNTRVTIATVSTYIESYNAHQETKIWFFRRRGYLTANGIQRMIERGCDETHGEPRTGTVVGIERAVMDRRA
jgi:hypothetical protein